VGGENRLSWTFFLTMASPRPADGGDLVVQEYEGANGRFIGLGAMTTAESSGLPSGITGQVSQRRLPASLP